MSQFYSSASSYSVESTVYCLFTGFIEYDNNYWLCCFVNKNYWQVSRNYNNYFFPWSIIHYIYISILDLQQKPEDTKVFYLIKPWIFRILYTFFQVVFLVPSSEDFLGNPGAPQQSQTPLREIFQEKETGRHQCR